MTFTHAGTVSHGTLREEDLVPAFLSTLKELDLERGLRIEHAYEDVIEHLMTGLEPNPDDVQALMEDLFDGLDACAPPGWSFGAHEGDGSDFGFWWGEDEDAEDE
jgi:hypothetical protein